MDLIIFVVEILFVIAAVVILAWGFRRLATRVPEPFYTLLVVLGSLLALLILWRLFANGLIVLPRALR